ncbi:MAG: hypothetical protein PHO37_08505 [Kiritimatiellae bacterium]|nr:hypothetical protein [Kiritimatiellia bacterium]
MDHKSLAQLNKLITAHSTPGEENEVKAILLQSWSSAGWQISELGNYAVFAHRPPLSSAQHPRLLICAHMDSPGFVVDRQEWSLPEESTYAQVHIVPLGSPCCTAEQTEARLKCRNGIFAGSIHVTSAEDDDDPEYHFVMAREEARGADLFIGDRVCFAPIIDCQEDLLRAPFLDNRLGCWMLSHLAELAAGWNQRHDIILGATSCEEINGFGAQVLAAQVEADLVLVLDATYAAAEQGVQLKGGAVITLSDASVLLSLATRDHLQQIMAEADVPIQFEAYNYSGTDSRAFPQQGKSAAVLSLLLPTHGNHSPCETAHLADLDSWERAIKVLERDFNYS